MRKQFAVVTAVWLVALALAAMPAQAQSQWNVVHARSTFQIELGKAGWLRVFGDEHVIAVSEYDCKAQFDPSNPAGGSVELVIPARALKVRDPHLTPEDRLQVQEKMEGAEVLDLARFHEIRFVSKRITTGEDGLYRMQGDLTIRGSSRPVAFDLRLTQENGGWRVRGVAPVQMTQFGIDPPSAGGGGIRVRDEMKIVFDLLLTAAAKE